MFPWDWDWDWDWFLSCCMALLMHVMYFSPFFFFFEGRGFGAMATLSLSVYLAFSPFSLCSISFHRPGPLGKLPVLHDPGRHSKVERVEQSEMDQHNDQSRVRWDGEHLQSGRLCVALQFKNLHHKSKLQILPSRLRGAHDHRPRHHFADLLAVLQHCPTSAIQRHAQLLVLQDPRRITIYPRPKLRHQPQYINRPLLELVYVCTAKVAAHSFIDYLLCAGQETGLL